MADKPSFLGGIYGMLFDPGGDVEGIRRAAAACRRLCVDLDGRVDAIDPVATGLADFWEGTAAQGFQRSWRRFRTDLRDYAAQLTADAAVSLDKIADMIREAQVQAHDAQLMILATLATGVAATVFTFGFSDAAAAGAVEVEVTALELFMARLAALLAGEAEAISALMSALATTIGRFLLGFVASEASSMLVKGLVFHQNVMDPATWQAKDLSKALLDAELVVGMGAMFSTPKLSATMDAHPYLGFTAAGAGGSAAFSMVSQFWFDHASVSDPKSWFNLAESTAIGAGSGLGMAGLFHGVPNAIQSLRNPGAAAGEPLGEQLALFGPDGKPVVEPLTGPHGEPLFPEERLPSGGLGMAVTGGDIARATTGLGSDMINYIINYPRKPEGLAAPQLPPPGPAGIDFPVPPPVLGGGTHTVHHGDSLWAIASRVYGDGAQWTAIAAANPHVADPDLIVSGQVLTLPELPAPHSSATG